jgi:peroxiredoxin
MRTDNLYALPPDLPVPVDDGAAAHLRGAAVPRIALASTSGRRVDLGDPERGLTVVYIYPHTGRPDRDPKGGLGEWNAIPGARGCTPQTCAFRDHHREIAALGAEVFGLSTQDTEYQKEMVERLHVPFDVLSDADFELTRALRLPTFEFAGDTFLKRLTLFVRGGRIVHLHYPVFPPDADAERVIAWLRSQYDPPPRA